jgi:CheY-like chemotaxis protein
MGGRELVRHLRQYTPGLPVVVLSGHTDDVGELFDGAGVTVLLGKPVSPDTLVEEVAVLVGRRRSPAADALAAAPAATPPPDA